MFNYTTKFDLKYATGADASDFTKKFDLASLKLEIDKSDIDILAKLDADKLKSVPVDLKKVDGIFTSKLVKKTDYNNKISYIEGKISSIAGLANTTALTAIENSLPAVNDVYNKIKSNNLCITLYIIINLQKI